MFNQGGKKFNWQPYRVGFVILAALSSIGFSVLVLITSNDYPVDSWPRIRPTVLLAVCAVVANVTVHQILATGLPIRWWLEAEHRGGSADKLRKIYADGSSMWVALCSILMAKPSTAALACLAVMVTAGSGPLLQKASRVETQTFGNSTVKITTHLATNLTVGFSGITDYNAGWSEVIAFSALFSAVVKAFSVRRTIQLSTDCAGTCMTMVEGVGFDLSCSDTTYSYDLSPEGPAEGADLFSSSVSLNDTQGNTSIRVTTYFKDSPADVGDGVTRDCILSPSIVLYNVWLNGTTATLLGDIKSDQVVKKLNITEGVSQEVSTLGGFVYAAKQKYDSRVTLQKEGSGWDFTSSGSLALEFHHWDGTTYKERNFAAMTWEDPTDTIIEGLRELMFRTAIEFGNSSTQPSSVSNGSMTSSGQVYKTDFFFMGLGVGAIMIGILGVIPVLWGGWNLNHHASLDPLDFFNWARENEKGPNTSQFPNSEYIKLVESND